MAIGNARSSLCRTVLSAPRPPAYASILSQRFLESEGELGRSFGRVLAKFGDLQLALAHTHTAADDATAVAASTAATDAAVAPPAPSPDEVFESLMRDMAAFEYALSHTRTVQDNAIVEMQNYDQKEAKTMSDIDTTVASLVDLQRELECAKQWRREQEEYEQLHKQLQSLPTRDATEAELASLARGEADLVAQREGLMAELVSKRSKHLLLSVAFEQLRAEWCAAERAASDASKSSRAAAEAEAEEERRRAEEEAAAYEAAAEAKASAAEAEDAEEGEEKKDDNMLMGGGDMEEGEEEGAAEEGAVEGAGAAPAAGTTPVANEDGQTTPAAADATLDAVAEATTTTTTTPTGDLTTASDDSAAAAPAEASTPTAQDSPAESPVPADSAAPMET